MTTRLSDIGEFEAIRRILASRQRGPGVEVGPGDDAAILRPTEGIHLAATTDAFVEGVHYRPGWLTDLELGGRLAAANLSDLAAVAARPRWGLISSGVRRETSIDAVVDRDRGISAVLRAHGAELVGGNLTAVTGPEWMSLTLIGECARDRAWTRHGARAGDLLAITGHPGRAAAGLAMLESPSAITAHEWGPTLRSAYATPVSRVELALRLADVGAVTAAIDISDGLASDLGHLCDASAVGAEIEEVRWPDDPMLMRSAAARGLEIAALWLGPSDDYELLLAIRPEARDAALDVARQAGAPLAIIGRCTPAHGLVWIVRGGSRRELARGGYDHYR